MPILAPVPPMSALVAPMDPVSQVEAIDWRRKCVDPDARRRAAALKALVLLGASDSLSADDLLAIAPHVMTSTGPDRLQFALMVGKMVNAGLDGRLPGDLPKRFEQLFRDPNVELKTRAAAVHVLLGLLPPNSGVATEALLSPHPELRTAGLLAVARNRTTLQSSVLVEAQGAAEEAVRRGVHSGEVSAAQPLLTDLL